MEETVKQIKELAQESLSATSGNIGVTGLKDEVRIIRDPWGVPHIYASNAEDLFYAEGYTHAQERLWQMEFNRRLASGALSELLGELPLDIDMFMRTIGLRRAAEASAGIIEKKCDKLTRTVMQAYVSGVNQFIESHLDSPPFEYRFLGLHPSPWKLADTTVCGLLVAWQLSMNWDNELLRAELIERLGEKRARDLLPFYPREASLIIPSNGAFADMTAPLLERQKKARGSLSSDAAPPGSNNWVVDGSKSATGMPLLANDPHLFIGMPSIWYELHLIGPGFNVMGVTFPGIPAVFIGHNERIAWGFTNLGSDIQDLYVEKLNPKNHRQYLYRGKWEDAEVCVEQFPVRGKEEPVVKEVLITRHGPIIDSMLQGMASPEVKKGLGRTVALRWTGHEPSHSAIALQGLLKLDQSGNWEEFKEALRLCGLISQNVVYADVEGNIGYVANSIIPIRARGQGLVPVPGWTGEYEWKGYIPFDELPSGFNPPNHFFATANNRIVDDDYPYLITHDWLPPHRVRRIVQMLTAKEKLSIDDFKKMQADVCSLQASELTPLLTRLKPKNKRQNEALDYFRSWDFRMDGDSIAAALYHVWYLRMMQNMLRDKLGEDIYNHYFQKRLLGNCFHILAMPGLLEYPTSYWFGDGSRSNAEKRDALISASLEQAIEELTKELGPNMSAWRWGRLHTATFRHLLGVIPPLDQILNAGPVSIGGDEYTVNNGGFDYGADFAQVIIPSYRQIVDLSDLSKSISMHSTGQSGQPASGHYKDFVEPWAKVEYHPMLFDKKTIERQAAEVLRLAPSGREKLTRKKKTPLISRLSPLPC
jgi:penicillin amidase